LTGSLFKEERHVAPGITMMIRQNKRGATVQPHSKRREENSLPFVLLISLSLSLESMNSCRRLWWGRADKSDLNGRRGDVTAVGVAFTGAGSNGCNHRFEDKLWSCARPQHVHVVELGYALCTYYVASCITQLALQRLSAFDECVIWKFAMCMHVRNRLEEGG